MKRLVLTLLAVGLLAPCGWARPVPKDFCTQGDFAAMLACQLWEADSNEQVSVSSAIDRLNLVEITPNDGWKPDQRVTRKVVQEVLARIHAHYSAQVPGQELTRQEVAGMLEEQEPAICRFQCRGNGTDCHRVYRPYYPLPAYTK